MLAELFHLPKTESEPLPIGEWFYEVIWCPSQCYYHLQVNCVDYVLYLRWRWENPWQAHVVKNAASLDEMHEAKAIWSEDVFALHRVHYTDEQLELAKERIINLFYEFNIKFPEQRPPQQNT